MALENKLGLTSSADLAREEERISKKRLWSSLKKVFQIISLPAGFLHCRQSINISLVTFTTSQSNFDEIVEKYVEMNIAHTFRDGNGRIACIWLDHILKNEIGKVVDWSKVDKDDYLLAMERSPIKDIEIKHILRAALTDEINSCEVYMKGIDHSYCYEGYTTFKAAEL